MEETRRRDISGLRHTYMEPSALTVTWTPQRNRRTEADTDQRIGLKFKIRGFPDDVSCVEADTALHAPIISLIRVEPVPSLKRHCLLRPKGSCRWPASPSYNTKSSSTCPSQVCIQRKLLPVATDHLKRHSTQRNPSGIAQK